MPEPQLEQLWVPQEAQPPPPLEMAVRTPSAPFEKVMNAEKSLRAPS